ncbi:alpha/beta hydrolase family protein [Chitinophaga eiseniae]|uniref:S9 family peptidase n=1 Tax=Chitinophaga eiseniae TaxID=634771 RepID=A0A847SHV7_9BACT|nr:prolyl oligopeptidase family serine peptidase [Chitinophaga eiseniae]NLR81421.1 S9 family peptidase [Chitinophaga eiseniae]
MNYFLTTLIVPWMLQPTQYLQNRHLLDSGGITKPPLTPKNYNRWPWVASAQISNNGKYNGYIFSSGNENERILKLSSKTNQWRLQSSISSSYAFSYNSKKAVWINSHDSLCLSTLGEKSIIYISNVSSFKINGIYVCATSKIPTNRSILINMQTSKISTFLAKNIFLLHHEHKSEILLYKKNGTQNSLIITDVNKKKQKKIWEGTEMNNITLDSKEEQLCFLSGAAQNQIWYFKSTMDSAIQIKLSIDDSAKHLRIEKFNSHGNYLFAKLIEQKKNLKDLNKTSVNVWHYSDNEMETPSLSTNKIIISTIAIRLSDKKIVRIDDKSSRLFTPILEDSIILIRTQHNPTSGDEVRWNESGNYSWYLKFLNEENVLKLNNITQNTIVEISPMGKYIVYFNTAAHQYFAYEVSSGIERNITININEKWEKNPNTDSYGRYIGGWEENDERVLIYGQRDIWKIDPTRKNAPINLTNGYGTKHNIIFFLSLAEYSNRPLLRNESLILSAFNVNTKYNGFFKKRLQKNGDPELLTMGPYLYDITDNPYIPSNASFSPIKALHSKEYIIRRMSAKEAPNYFVTTDFKLFKRISDQHPEKEFIWYTTELHSWISLDRKRLCGILYKPENFDSSKKYPIIINHYEKKTDCLNAYITPKALEGGCGINIPYYVSNGYLIFCPDIYYNIGDPMQGAYDAIISAVHYAAGLQFIDQTKVGIQGCSWGAIQTNYLIAHSNLFAAACSTSGIANWISGYNTLNGFGGSMQGMFESGQFRVGGTLWDKPDIYIKNSAVINANEIKTPLLLMHTRNDALCNIQNIMELFVALRKLGKKTWMLIYKGNHGLVGDDEIDFSKKMKQFFDYYLQNGSAPEWMSNTLE